MRALVVLVLLAAVRAAAAADPTPPSTPTPPPRTLPEYAQKARFAPAAVRGDDGRIVISDRTLAALAESGHLTTAAATGSPPPPPPAAVDPGVKQRWLRAHAAQRKVVERLERRRSNLLTELDRVRDLSPTARTLAREDALRSDLAALDRDLAAARDELARVVRAARGEGAEPGWFRGAPGG